MKVISFSLWGNNPTYTIGAIKNADIAAELFPDWKCIFYCFTSVPETIIAELKCKPNVIIRMVEGDGDNRGMFHRFYPAEEEGVERMICRDTDSRLSPREVLAVEDWIKQGTDFHVIRDHPYHNIPILGGMWGVVCGKLEGMIQSAIQFSPTSEKGQDQRFLVQSVWSKISNGHLTVTVHDDIFTNNPFPIGATRGDQNRGVWFIGQVFDENNKYNSQSDVDVLLKVIQK
jgi:hypothetical protein